VEVRLSKIAPFLHHQLLGSSAVVMRYWFLYWQQNSTEYSLARAHCQSGLGESAFYFPASIHRRHSQDKFVRIVVLPLIDQLKNRTSLSIFQSYFQSNQHLDLRVSDFKLPVGGLGQTCGGTEGGIGSISDFRSRGMLEIHEAVWHHLLKAPAYETALSPWQ